jgi:hypothetical protein
MSAEHALFNAYAEWRRLARAAHRAICKRDWTFLLECQRVIRGIQPNITKLTLEARNEWKQPKVDGAIKEEKLRAVISELKGLLGSNQKLLEACRNRALSEREKLEQAGRNLKRLQNSYVSARSSAWASFS